MGLQSVAVDLECCTPKPFALCMAKLFEIGEDGVEMGIPGFLPTHRHRQAGTVGCSEGRCPGCWQTAPDDVVEPRKGPQQQGHRFPSNRQQKDSSDTFST